MTKKVFKLISSCAKLYRF